ncbi:MAG: formate dehydrogenase accessory protein FdhE [Lautropia sp.]|nr:formate dehydrogenase accessory protein FdhE [Lautropia sp.]
MQRILQPGEIEALDRTAFPRIRLPQPGSLFLDRAARLRHLAEGSPMADFLRYVARLMDAQHQLFKGLPEAAQPADETYLRAQTHAMPLWQVSAETCGDLLPVLHALLDELEKSGEHTEFQRLQMDELRQMDGRGLMQLVDAVLMAAPLNESRRVKAPFVMAALQVAMTAKAAVLDPGKMPYVDPPTVCPVCSSHPVASIIRIDGQSAGLRYLHCGVCATEWHMVRVKCSNCASTKGISYRRLADADQPQVDEEAAVACMAELCSSCGSYRKLFDLQKDHAIEALSDDLATLALDILMGEEGHARAGLNPFLIMNAEAD